MSHFTETERKVLENLLMSGRSMEEISHALGKHRTSVCRELKRNRSEAGVGLEDGECPRLQLPPYVCNSCAQEAGCHWQKWYYLYNHAEEKYRKLLTSSRDGFNLSPQELERIDKIVSHGISLGQSLHHILAAHANEIMLSERTLYRLVNANMLSVKRHNLRMAPYRKPRASKLKQRARGREMKVDKACTIGRTYEDYMAFIAGRKRVRIVEIDTVEGPRGTSKVLLTINFNDCGLMLAFIREANTAQSVIDVFNRLERLLGLSRFRTLFPVLLTDNGSEFSNPKMLEESPDTQLPRTRLFYCHPLASSEKPHVENNHENLRKVIEKGLSFDDLSQEDVDKVVCHMNSLLRKEYDDRPAIDRFTEMYGKRAAKLLGLKLVPADDVHLKPELLGGKLKRMN